MKETIIKCPNCKMGRQYKYEESRYTPIYGQCTFCNTLWRWSKSKTIEIIPQDKKLWIHLPEIFSQPIYIKTLN